MVIIKKGYLAYAQNEPQMLKGLLCFDEIFLRLLYRVRQLSEPLKNDQYMQG